ncbi:MAG: GNAT family N-acetyltransferase [Vibrio sp.]
MSLLRVKDHLSADFMTLDIVTPRIRLVPVSATFATAILRELSPEITQYMTPDAPQKLSDVSSFIEESVTDMQAGKEIMLAITDVRTHDFIGICCCAAKDSPHTPELGVWVKKSAHGKKLGLESVTALVEWARENLIYDVLTYPVDRANIASRKIPEALCGQIFEEKPLDTQSGIPLDGVVYNIA